MKERRKEGSTNLDINKVFAGAIKGKAFEVLFADTTITSLGVFTFAIADRSFGSRI
jgi:hypothetical protein